MGRRLIACLIIFTPFLGGAAAQDYQEAYRRVVGSVVVVWNPITGGRGGGVVVAPMRVLTNRHVTEGAREVEVRTRDGRALPATVLRELKRHDLALVLAQSEQLASIGQPVEISTEELQHGQPLFLVGHPAPTFWAFSVAWVATGELMGVRADGRLEKLVYLQCLALRGYSGSPVFDRAGRLVGITSTITPDELEVKVGDQKGTVYAHAPLGGIVPIRHACRKLIDCDPAVRKE